MWLLSHGSGRDTATGGEIDSSVSEAENGTNGMSSEMGTMAGNPGVVVIPPTAGSTGTADGRSVSDTMGGRVVMAPEGGTVMTTTVSAGRVVSAIGDAAGGSVVGGAGVSVAGGTGAMVVVSATAGWGVGGSVVSSWPTHDMAWMGRTVQDYQH